MQTLSRQRCFHHASREAVARCPECGRFYCRECITEHEDRVLCATCLQALTRKAERRRSRLGGVTRMCAAVAGVILAWMFFHMIGSVLISIPARFHDGTLWSTPASKEAE